MLMLSLIIYSIICFVSQSTYISFGFKTLKTTTISQTNAITSTISITLSLQSLKYQCIIIDSSSITPNYTCSTSNTTQIPATQCISNTTSTNALQIDLESNDNSSIHINEIYINIHKNMDRTNLIMNRFCHENECLDTILINSDEPHILFSFETSSNMEYAEYTKPNEQQNCNQDISQSSMTINSLFQPTTTKSLYPSPSFYNDSQTVLHTEIDIKTVRNVFIVWVIIFIICCIFPTIIGIAICVSLYKREEIIKDKELKLRHHVNVNTEESVKDSDSNRSKRTGSDDSKVVVEMENELAMNTTMNWEEEEELVPKDEDKDKEKNRADDDKDDNGDDDEDKNREEPGKKNDNKSEPNLEEIQNMNLSITIGEVSHAGINEENEENEDNDNNDDIEKKDGDEKHLAPPPEASRTQTVSSVVDSLIVQPRYSQDLRSVSLFKQINLSDVCLEPINESKSIISDDNDNNIDYKNNDDNIQDIIQKLQITRSYKIEIEPSQDDEFALYLNHIHSGKSKSGNEPTLSEMLKISRHNTPDYFEASKESKENDGIMTDKLNINTETLQQLGETELYGLIDRKGKGCMSIETILTDGMYEGGQETTTTIENNKDSINDTVQTNET